MYSFHALINTINATEKIAGLISGSMILKNIPAVEQPSIFAASSNPFGSCEKKLVNSHMDNGNANVIYGMISPKYVFNKPNCFNISDTCKMDTK